MLELPLEFKRHSCKHNFLEMYVVARFLRIKRHSLPSVAHLCTIREAAPLSPIIRPTRWVPRLFPFMARCYGNEFHATSLGQRTNELHHAVTCTSRACRRSMQMETTAAEGTTKPNTSGLVVGLSTAANNEQARTVSEQLGCGGRCAAAGTASRARNQKMRRRHAPYYIGQPYWIACFGSAMTDKDPPRVSL